MERLDEFSKLLAESVSRRESLRSIGVVLAGVVLSPLGLSTAWAARPDRCTAFCRWCPGRTRRNQCLAACRACNGNTSRLCGSCGNFVCCATGTACCNGTCTPVNSDPNNCGACGNVCGGMCVDTSSNAQHCGGCFQACPVGQVCYVGSCCSPTVSCCFDPCPE